MRNLFAGLIVITICMVGFGFYRGWFALSSPSPAAGSNEVNVNLTTDTDKIKEDAETVKDKAAELTGKVKEDVSESSNRTKDEVQPSQVSPAEGQSRTVDPNVEPTNRN